MSAGAWNTIITGLFVLASAALGFFGSLFTANRAAEFSLEQLRYERVHARREEVLSEVYVLLLDVEDAFRKLVTMRGTPAEKVGDMEEANSSITRLIRGYRKGWPWIPEEVGEQIIPRMEEYQGFMDEISEEIRGGPIDHERYAAVFAEAKLRLVEMIEAQDHLRLLREIRGTLGIEEPPS